MRTQIKRWGEIKGDVDYKAVAEQVYLATDTKKVMAEMGLTPPATSYKSFAVMGKTFDPAKPDDYLASFKIRKASRCGRTFLLRGGWGEGDDLLPSLPRSRGFDRAAGRF